MPFQGLSAANDRDLNDTLRPLMYEEGDSDIEHPDIALTSITGPFNPSFSSSSTARSISSSAAGSFAYNPMSSSPQDKKDNALTHRVNSRSGDPAVRRAESIDRMGQLSKEEWQVLPTDMFALKGNNYTKAELTARTPWLVFLTDPVALAILACAFTNVRFFCNIFRAAVWLSVFVADTSLRVFICIQIHHTSVLILFFHAQTGMDRFYSHVRDAIVSYRQSGFLYRQRGCLLHLNLPRDRKRVV